MASEHNRRHHAHLAQNSTVAQIVFKVTGANSFGANTGSLTLIVGG